ncbi:MAG: type 4a pilus biogenesis protein PilO [Bryobacteraceae bacterium]
MPRKFNLTLPAGLSSNLSKDPRLVARVVLGVLLLANLLAAYAVFQPFGGTAESLDEQHQALSGEVQRRQANLKRLRALVSKIEQARTSGDDFLGTYFMARRTASSTIVSELNQSAKDAGIRPREHSFAFDPIEGSDTLSMMTISANYEGTYGDLLQFVNKLDKSQRFLILDTLTAAPQLGTGNLAVNIKLNTFVREEKASL